MFSAILWATLLLPQTEAPDYRWSPWLGCFRLVGDELLVPEFPPELASDELERTPVPSPDARVCLTPEGAGVRVRTFADGEAFLEELLVADGKQYPVSEGACTGWQRSDWSSDLERLYTVSELTCEDGRLRRVSGISMFVGPSWVEIQSVSSNHVGSVQVRRYRPVDEDEAMALGGLSADVLQQAVRARAVVASRLSMEDVIEAAVATDAAAVEAAVMEGRTRFSLDAQKLVELDDAGVSPELIDVMVALSYPEKFVIDREQDRDSGGGSGYIPGYYGGYDPYYASPFAYPYFYAPFGYYYWYAPYHPIYGVRPLPTPGASVGRVIAGRGYTFVDRRGPSGGDGSGRYAKPRGSGRGSDGGSVGSGSSSEGSGGTASPSGYSRGGSTGRSAKPKKR